MCSFLRSHSFAFPLQGLYVCFVVGANSIVVVFVIVFVVAVPFPNVSVFDRLHGNTSPKGTDFVKFSYKNRVMETRPRAVDILFTE